MTRLLYFTGLLAACLLLGVGFYLEIKTGFTPCPLCILQRVVFCLLGLLCIVGLVFANKKRAGFITSALLSLIAIAGILLAGRQVWLQHMAPTNHEECGVSLQYMLHVFPLQEVVQKIFSGSAECTTRGLTFLSLDLAEWALLWFIGFLILGGWLFLNAVRMQARQSRGV